MKRRHGTPDEFDRMVMHTPSDLTTEEKEAVADNYRILWLVAPDKACTTPPVVLASPAARPLLATVVRRTELKPKPKKRTR